MRTTPISPRRRQVLIAGLASAAAPAGVLAGECAALTALSTDSAITESGALIVSGRIVGADCKPLAHTTVDIAGLAERTSTTTDGDGRFVVRTHAHAGQRELAYRIAGEPMQRLSLGAAVRDEAGAWRATFAATIA